MCSCSGNTDNNSQPAADGQAQEAVEAEASQPGVITLADDSAYRPGMKPERLTVLDFNAVWCGPCRKFTPTFEEAPAKYGDRVDFVAVDVDNNPQTAEAFGVSSIPCVKVIHTDGTVDTYAGLDDLLPAEKFHAILDNAL